MRFLSKIRERQFAKKWGGAYNLSRAVLAGVLAAGCLMPGFAEAASFDMAYWKETEEDEYHGLKGEHYTQVGNIANIISFDGINGIADYVEIFWENEGAIVADRTINVNEVNSPNMNITPDIIIKGGYVDNGNAISNTVNISNVTFENSAEIYGGFSGSVGVASFSENTRSNGTVTGNTVTINNIVTIKDTTFKDYAAIFGEYTSNNVDVTGNTVTIENTTFNNEAEIFGGYTSGDGNVTGNTVEIIGNTTFTSASTSNIYGGYSVDGQANGNSVKISGGTFENIFGGYASSGTAEGNRVEINGGQFDANVYGGLGATAANGNSFIINDGTFNAWITGGDGSKAANGNIVKIDGGTINAVACGGLSYSGEAKKNSVIINAGTIKSYVYGGYADSASGKAIENSVEINGGTFNGDVDVRGGYSKSGEATGNSVEINGGTFNGSVDVYGGYAGANSGEATGNSVIINVGTFKDIFGGWATSSSGKANGNSVEINGGTITGWVKGGRGAGTANGNSVSISGGNFKDIYGGDGSTAANGNSVIISGGTFSNVYGGESRYGTAKDNRVIINGCDFIFSVSGGESVTGEANGNSVSISGGTFGNAVYGGHSTSSGEANGNSVIISDGRFINSDSAVYGGHGKTAANGNSVSISGGNFKNIYGGYVKSNSGEANKNKVILVGKNENNPLSAEQILNGSGKININGTVYGGHVFDSNSYNSTDNEIHVYGSNINVGHIDGFNKLHFFIDDKMTFGETMLTIKGVTNSPNVTISDVTISKDNLAVKVTGKPKASDDSTNNTITLIHNKSANIKYSNDITKVPVEIGRLLTGEGSVDLVNNDKDLKDLVLTLNVEKTTVNENGKSLVETRAAAAFVVNNMSDFMLGTGMEQAKAAAGGVTPIDAGTMAPFAAVGGSNMRYTTGSYVDVNGWNGAVGFAKQADKLLFGVAVEHGRGNYDSYLDNGVHASGDIKSTGGVIFGEYKLDNGVHYDAALRAGRVKSDYNSTATSYDESSTYYGFSLGGGKELTVSDKATLDVYGRYYFSHTNGSDVSIATGEEIDFDAVNSHRLRIGGRYTTTLTEKSKAYAGLAWQYEFGGDAKAAINGYSAPTPSLQGHSAIVEAGYKLNAGKNLTLDFNLNGAMGKQRGIGGGIGAQWLF